MGITGVVSVGLGQDEDGNMAIIVGVDRPLADITETLPMRLDGYPVIVEVLGRIKPQ